MILLKSFFTQIMVCFITYFLYAWMWNIGTNWWVWTIFVIFMVIVCCGYIATGYWINDGKMEGIRPILSIYVLSGTIMIFMVMATLYNSDIKVSPLIIVNLPFILLLEYQKLVIGVHGSQIAYIFSGLLPSVLIHSGFVIKRHVLK